MILYHQTLMKGSNIQQVVTGMTNLLNRSSQLRVLGDFCGFGRHEILQAKGKTLELVMIVESEFVVIHSSEVFGIIRGLVAIDVPCTLSTGWGRPR